MLPPLQTLNHLFTDKAACLRFLQAEGVFYELNACPACGSDLMLTGEMYRCRRKKASLLRHSFGLKYVISPTLIM
jgi:hypothetical protein